MTFQKWKMTFNLERSHFRNARRHFRNGRQHLKIFWPDTTCPHTSPDQARTRCQEGSWPWWWWWWWWRRGGGEGRLASPLLWLNFTWNKVKIIDRERERGGEGRGCGGEEQGEGEGGGGGVWRMASKLM